MKIPESHHRATRETIRDPIPEFDRIEPGQQEPHPRHGERPDPDIQEEQRAVGQGHRVFEVLVGEVGQDTGREQASTQ